MKPNLKPRQQLVKTTFDGQSKPYPNKKIQQKKQVVEQQQFEPLGESIVGEREFIYFDNNNKSNLNNNSSMHNRLYQNASLVGTMEKVYFANASTVNKDEFEKDRRLQEEVNAFKPMPKVVNEPVQNFSKKPKSTSLPQNGQHQEQDENEFLQLTTVGKWNKNKSTVISEEMKKMNSHLENRLTQTKWAKKKPSHHQQTSKTQKNSSMTKNQSTQINTPTNNSRDGKNNTNISMKVISTQHATSTTNVLAKDQSVTQHSIHVKKSAQKYMEAMSDEAKQKVSSMTSWKQEEKVQEPEQVEDEAEDQGGESEEQESEEEQEEEQQEEESEEQEDEEQEQVEGGEEQGGEEQSSGDDGWDEPQQKQPQEQPQQVKQDPFAVPQPQTVTQIKAKKWGSKIDTNSKLSTYKNSSIMLSGQPQEKEQQQQDNDHIEDLTEGEIPNEEVDPEWEKIEKILLRIQKLVN